MNEVVKAEDGRSTIERSAMATLAARLGVDASKAFTSALRQVAFGSSEITNEQLMALVIVANQYKLNPFTRELYAFPDRKSGGIVPIVSVDGWYRIINEHPQFDGLEYRIDKDEEFGVFGECTIYRKDRGHAITVREYLQEVKRGTDPWKQHTQRMLRHKTIIQCARVAFGFAGIYEPDEGERIVEVARVQKPEGRTGEDKARAALGVTAEPSATAFDEEPRYEPISSEPFEDDELPL